MPRMSLATSLEKSITQLLEGRQHHLDALAEIDAVFARFGITPGTKHIVRKVRAGRKPGRKRHRGTFSETAEEFVLRLLKGKTMTTAEINSEWKMAGRGGVANNTLTRLVAEKKVKRASLKEGKGSAYSVR